MPTLVFAHIPKTAGTSISNSLSSLFTPERVSGHIDANPPASTKDLDLIVSHFPFPRLEMIEGDKVYVTCLREPVSRLLSIYQFWHSFSPLAALQSGNPQVLDARRMTFDQFILSDEPHLVEIVDNGMVRHFANVAGRVGDSDFTEACSAIDRMSAIVFHERLSDTMADLYGRLDCFHRLSLKKLNVTSNNYLSDPVKYTKVQDVDISAMSPEAIDALVRATAYDRRLYDHAVMRYESHAYKASQTLGTLSITRPRLSFGETVTPSTHHMFVGLLCGGWTPPDEALWTHAPLATLKFKSHNAHNDRLARIRIRFCACLIPRREYVFGSLSVDDSVPRSVLFVNVGSTIEMAGISSLDFEMICVGAESAEMTFDLALSSDPEFIHKVEFRCLGMSPPALLTYNNDDRSLGIRLESLKLL